MSKAIISARNAGKATSAGGNAQKRRERFEPIWDWELDEQPDLVWLVDRVLPAGGFGVLFGESGIGKSFVALDLAYTVALGRPWCGHAVQQGAVLYVAAEGSIGGLKKRARAWRQFHEIALAPVAFLPHSVVLDPAGTDVQALIALIGNTDPKPALVILDTVARCLNGNENSTEDMNAYVRAADAIREATGAHVLHVHHTPKRDPWIERGSNALRGAADVMLRVARNKGRVELAGDKGRESINLRRHRLTLTAVPDTDSVVVELEALQAADVPDELATSQQQAIETLRSVLGGSAASSKWKDATGLKPRTFYAAVAALVASGVVEKTGSEKRPVYTAVTATADALQNDCSSSIPAFTAATATTRRVAVSSAARKQRPGRGRSARSRRRIAADGRTGQLKPHFADHVPPAIIERK